MLYKWLHLSGDPLKPYIKNAKRQADMTPFTSFQYTDSQRVGCSVIMWATVSKIGGYFAEIVTHWLLGLCPI